MGSNMVSNKNNMTKPMNQMEWLGIPLKGCTIKDGSNIIFKTAVYVREVVPADESNDSYFKFVIIKEPIRFKYEKDGEPLMNYRLLKLNDNNDNICNWSISKLELFTTDFKKDIGIILANVKDDIERINVLQALNIPYEIKIGDTNEDR